MPSSHLILCHPLLMPPIPASVRVFSSESTLRMRWPKYWSFSFSISPSKEHMHGNGVHHIHSHSNDQNWTYVLSISLSLSAGVSQTTLLPSVLGTSGSEVHIFVFAQYFLSKSWGPMQLGFDIVSHSNKQREATNTHFIFQFFLNLYKMPKGRYTVIFQNVSSECSLITVPLNIFHTENILWNSPHLKPPCLKSPLPYSPWPLPFVFHTPVMLSINLACLTSLAFSRHAKESYWLT